MSENRQRDVLRQALGRTPECPPLDLLAAPRLDAALQRHLEDCPHCRAELALLHQFETAEALPDETADLAWMEAELARRSPVAPAPRGSFSNRLRDWFELLLAPAGRGRLALAAAAMLVLVTAGVFLRPGAGVRPAPGEEQTVWRSGQFAAVAPQGDLDRPPSQLRWEPVPDAASYRVRLLEVDGTEIWSDTTSATSVDFPSSIAPKLTAGRAFQWGVIAHNAGGKPIAATNLQTFHILVTRR